MQKSGTPFEAPLCFLRDAVGGGAALADVFNGVSVGLQAADASADCRLTPSRRLADGFDCRTLLSRKHFDNVGADAAVTEGRNFHILGDAALCSLHGRLGSLASALGGLGFNLRVTAALRDNLDILGSGALRGLRGDGLGDASGAGRGGLGHDTLWVEGWGIFSRVEISTFWC